MSVYVQSIEPVCNKSEMRYVISMLTIRTAGDGSVRIIDKMTLAYMTIE